jgi:deoxyribodipyrimidine photo-lyase
VVNACSGQSEQVDWFSYERETMLEQPVPDVLAAHEPPQLSTTYPDSDTIPTSDTYVLYTPWTLDPTYQSGLSATRVLIIDPAWFDRLPVSPQVLDFIIAQGQAVIPSLLVHVGAPAEIATDEAEVHFRDHQTNQTWVGERDSAPNLVPAVTGYYPSFFKYWQQAERHL